MADVDVKQPEEHVQDVEEARPAEGEEGNEEVGSTANT